MARMMVTVVEISQERSKLRIIMQRTIYKAHGGAQLRTSSEDLNLPALHIEPICKRVLRRFALKERADGHAFQGHIGIVSQEE